MIKVHLWSGLRRLAGGAEAVTVQAATVGQMFDAMIAAHPGLEPFIKAGVSVVIDGEVTAGGRNLAVKPENEIYLIQRVKGG
jgi:hypothetical protein